MLWRIIFTVLGILFAWTNGIYATNFTVFLLSTGRILNITMKIPPKRTHTISYNFYNHFPNVFLLFYMFTVRKRKNLGLQLQTRLLLPLKNELCVLHKNKNGCKAFSLIFPMRNICQDTHTLMKWGTPSKMVNVPFVLSGGWESIF